MQTVATFIIFSLYSAQTDSGHTKRQPTASRGESSKKRTLDKTPLLSAINLSIDTTSSPVTTKKKPKTEISQRALKALKGAG